MEERLTVNQVVPSSSLGSAAICICGEEMQFLGHCKYVCRSCGWLIGCSEGIY